MEKAYAAADVVISRSGAMTVSELCVVSKPAIFVPFPFAAEDHQTVNAMALVKKNAALIVPDAKAKSDLFPCLLQLIKDNARMTQLATNIGKLANLNADEMIAMQILNEIKNDKVIS